MHLSTFPGWPMTGAGKVSGERGGMAGRGGEVVCGRDTGFQLAVPRKWESGPEESERESLLPFPPCPSPTQSTQHLLPHSQRGVGAAGEAGALNRFTRGRKGRVCIFPSFSIRCLPFSLCRSRLWPPSGLPAPSCPHTQQESVQLFAPCVSSECLLDLAETLSTPGSGPPPPSICGQSVCPASDPARQTHFPACAQGQPG